MREFTGRSVLVTGADGFIGSHLTEVLHAAGARVTALAQYNSFGHAGWLEDLEGSVYSDIDIRFGDVRDGSFVRDLVSNREIVFHLAALIGIPYSYYAPQSYIDVNVSGTLNLLEASRAAGVARFVHTSTSEVYGTAQFTPITEAHPVIAQSPYAASKIGADMMVSAYVRSFEFPAVILRPFNTYGPRQSERAVLPTIIRQALDPECEAIHLGDLTPIRDFNYVQDIARAFAFAATAEALEFGLPYNAGSGTAITVDEAVDIVRGLCGTNKPVESDDERRRPKNSEVFELLADAERFSNDTGWTSEVDLEAGLSQTISWWRARTASGQLRQSKRFLY